MSNYFYNLIQDRLPPATELRNADQTYALIRTHIEGYVTGYTEAFTSALRDKLAATEIFTAALKTKLEGLQQTQVTLWTPTVTPITAGRTAADVTFSGAERYTRIGDTVTLFLDIQNMVAPSIFPSSPGGRSVDYVATQSASYHYELALPFPANTDTIFFSDRSLSLAADRSSFRLTSMTTLRFRVDGLRPFRYSQLTATNPNSVGKYIIVYTVAED